MSDDCPHGVDQIECWLCAENADAEAWRADRAELVALRAEVTRLRAALELARESIDGLDRQTSLNCWREDGAGDYVVTAKSVHEFVAETRVLLARAALAESPAKKETERDAAIKRAEAAEDALHVTRRNLDAARSVIEATLKPALAAKQADLDKARALLRANDAGEQCWDPYDQEKPAECCWDPSCWQHRVDALALHPESKQEPGTSKGTGS